MQLLKKLCDQWHIPRAITVHAVTRSAAETQSVLPTGCLVQKTITGRVAGKLLLWTGVSDFSVSKQQRKYAARALHISTARDHSFNPVDINPAEFFAMQDGMVSPFLISNTPAVSELSAVVLLAWPPEQEQTASVAISLSLTESLIIPLAGLGKLLHAYAETVFPELPILTIPLDLNASQVTVQ